MFIKSFGYGSRIGLFLLVCMLMSATATESVGQFASGSLAAAGARTAWKISFPLRSIDSVRSYCLLEEYLYALASNGKVYAIQVDTGRYAWGRPLTDAGDTLWPPVAYHEEDMDAVVFTRLTDVVFINQNTGEILKRCKLLDPARAPVAVTKDVIFAVETNNRLSNYHMDKLVRRWEMRTSAPFGLAPLYLDDKDNRDQLFVVDNSGLLASLNSKDRFKRFSHQLAGTPQGHMAADKKSVYIATSDNKLYVFDRKSGEHRIFRLDNPPADGPVVTEDAVYQSIQGGGIYRIPKVPDVPHWFIKDCKGFLAKWAHHDLLLRNDGKIVFVRPQTGKIGMIMDAGDVAGGVSNVMNDAVIVYSARGDVRCIRPIGAKRLTPADFKPKPEESKEPEPAAAEESTEEGEEKPAAEEK